LLITERLTFPIGWHPFLVSFAADPLHQSAGLGFSFYECRPIVAAGQCPVATIEPKSGLFLLGTVTLVAMLGKDWLYVFDEVNFRRSLDDWLRAFAIALRRRVSSDDGRNGRSGQYYNRRQKNGPGRHVRLRQTTGAWESG
jgi:hypothetical protein